MAFFVRRRTGNEKACLQKQLRRREHVKSFCSRYQIKIRLLHVTKPQSLIEL